MTSNNNVNAVALKLPPFWTSLPGHWFVQVESQFNLRQVVTERTKYDYVLAALPQEAVASVYDVIQQISDANADNPINDPYTRIKKALIDRHTLSEAKRIEVLLSGADLGDKKPSELFRSMKTLAGNSEFVNDKLIISLWMRRLPQMVQASLKSIPDADTNALVTMADNVFEISAISNPMYGSTSSSNVFAISKPSTSNSDPSIQYLMEKNQELEFEISEIKRMVSELNVNMNSRSRSNTRNRSRSRNFSRNRQANQSGLCWYHAKFGQNAKHCQPNCTYSSKTSPN